jgi:hypothetical protein
MIPSRISSMMIDPRRRIPYKLLPRGNNQKKLGEKASLYEGHGFSRAVTIVKDDGFSR